MHDDTSLPFTALRVGGIDLNDFVVTVNATPCILVCPSGSPFRKKVYPAEASRQSSQESLVSVRAVISMCYRTNSMTMTAVRLRACVRLLSVMARTGMYIPGSEILVEILSLGATCEGCQDGFLGLL